AGGESLLQCAVQVFAFVGLAPLPLIGRLFAARVAGILFRRLGGDEWRPRVAGGESLLQCAVQVFAFVGLAPLPLIGRLFAARVAGILAIGRHVMTCCRWPKRTALLLQRLPGKTPAAVPWSVCGQGARRRMATTALSVAHAATYILLMTRCA